MQVDKARPETGHSASAETGHGAWEREAAVGIFRGRVPGALLEAQPWSSARICSSSCSGPTATVVCSLSGYFFSTAATSSQLTRR